MSENTPVYARDGEISARFAAIIDQVAEHVTPVLGTLAPDDQVMIAGDLDERIVVAFKVPTGEGADVRAYPLYGIPAIVALQALADLMAPSAGTGLDARYFGQAADGRVWHFQTAPKPAPVDAPAPAA